MNLFVLIHSNSSGFLVIAVLNCLVLLTGCFALFYFQKYQKSNPLNYNEILRNLRNQEFLVNFSNYLNSTHGNFSHRINNALHILGKHTNVDRVFIFEDYGNGKMTRNTFEWCRENTESQISKFQRIVYKKPLIGWKAQLIKDGVIFANQSNDFPQDLRDLLIHRNTNSAMGFPLYVSNEFYGFIGFDSCSLSYQWNDMDIGFLKTIVMILCNVFEQRITDQKIKNSEIKFRDLFNLSSDSIFIYNLHGEILEVNLQACEKMEYDREQLIHSEFIKLFNPTRIHPDQLFQTGENNEIQIYESVFQTKTGKHFPVEINSRFIKFYSKQAILCVARDISERKQMEHKILSAIIQTEEKERGRIARDLHDGLGPMLSSLKLYTSVVAKTDDKTKQEQVIRTTNEMIDESMIMIKEISNNLSPHVLNDFGLASAIQSFCKKITLTKSIDIKFDSNVFDQRFEINTEMVLFRTLKELVNNTIKHALAQKIDIFLLRTENTLTLIYGDDGVGFNLKKVLDDPISGMGISNIINRINSINGKLMFESHTSKGVQMKIEVELK